jgi:hypothetical protein
MRIDNLPVLSNREPDPDEAAFWTKLAATLVKALDMECLPDIVRAYRQLEAESLPHAGDDSAKILEIKRLIAHGILMAGHEHEQAFEVYRDTWNVLVELGFSNIQMLCSVAWYYAYCCMLEAQYDIGLSVLDEVTTEIYQRLAEPGLTKWTKSYYDGELTTLKKLREGLVAFQSSTTEGTAWVHRRDAEYDARDEHWMKRDGRNRELDIALDRAMDSIANASWSRSWAETAHDYRQLEADFVARLQDSDEFFVSEARRRIRCAILMGADKHHEPFEVCRDLWNELLSFDFTNILQKCAIAWFYADSCVFNHQPEAGLAVVEPLLAELQRQVDTGTDEETLQEYQDALARLEKLRDELKALSE